MSLPVPYSGRSPERALRKAESDSLVRQAQALTDARLHALREDTAYRDAARRISQGFDLAELAIGRTAQLHGRVKSIPDPELREVFEIGLGQTFGAALARTHQYMRET